MDPQRISPINATSFAQKITFKGSDANYSVQIVAQDVTVNCSLGNHNHGSSKVKLTNVVDYNWEQKYYIGHLLAVHVSGKYFAYGIKGRSATGKGGGMVRVATHDSRMRALIKEMGGQVQDIDFAHTYNAVILACVDDEGSLFVHNIEEQDENLVCSLLLHVVQTEVITPNSPHRVVWCPFVPVDDQTDDSKLLVLTHGHKAELINVAVINSKHGIGPLKISDLTEDYLEINVHSQPIMDAAFSPDATAVATASMDGFVKFFQIYMHNGTRPRCLHEWQPHDGKPLSCLMFLDNFHMYAAEEDCWKFAITGCNNNTELKIWSCVSWKCMQTIHFVPNPSQPANNIFFKARVDLGSNYLFLSDINNRVLYIFELHKDRRGCNAFARSISEFLLPAPVLSFGILEASSRKFRYSNSTEDLYPCEESDEFDDGQNIVATVVRMYVIQPKRLQECQIVFQPDSCQNLPTVSSPRANSNLLFPAVPDQTETVTETETATELTPSNNETVVNQLSQLSLSTNILPKDIPKHFNDLQNLLIQPSQPLNLMTPDAFSSPAKTDNSDLNESTRKSATPTLMTINSPIQDSINTVTTAEATTSASTINANDILTFQRAQKDNFASGGSSPSREVQEILSLNNANYATHEYYENDKASTENVEVLTEKNDDFNQGTTYQTGATSLFNETSNLNADGWPSIALLKANEVLSNEENRLNLQECNLNAADSLAAVNRKNSSDVNVHTLEQWIISLVSMVREQNNQIQQLHNEITELKISQEKCSVPEDLENIIAKQLDLALARSHAQQTKLFESWANARVNKDREHQEAITTNITHVVSKQVYEKLQNIVNIEMKQTVLPVVIGTFENLKHLMQEDFTQRITATDQMVKDNLNKFATSKIVADSISTSIVNVLRPNMEKCYREIINNTLLPSWEKVCNAMFQQVNETFAQGTKEYTQSLESYLDKHHRRTQDKGREMVTQMQGLTETMRTNTEKLNTTLPAELHKQILAAFSSMQDKLSSNMTELIKEHVATAFRNHASILEDSVMNAVRSRAVTPSPYDAQIQLAHIQQLLTQGLFNTAFQQALSASDLSLVVYICERLNPQAVFSQSPCPLQQPVLLSLIQQLSADMSNQTELKIRYLEEAVLNLDPAFPVTKEHMSTVLRELVRQLAAFITANPTHKVVHNMKMLQMAAQAFLKS